MLPGCKQNLLGISNAKRGLLTTGEVEGAIPGSLEICELTFLICVLGLHTLLHTRACFYGT
jgi:hypothetical protein